MKLYMYLHVCKKILLVFGFCIGYIHVRECGYNVQNVCTCICICIVCMNLTLSVLARGNTPYLHFFTDGVLSPFNNFSVSLEKQSGSVIAYLKWDYPGNRSQIRGYRTVVHNETEVFHNKTLERNTNVTSCNIPPQNTYTASVQAINRCTGHSPVVKRGAYANT